MELTKEILHSMFHYENGNLIRKVSRRSFKKGSIAGGHSSNGYYRIGIFRKSYMLHRVIFMFHHGYFPEEIDHINGNPSDNRIENLRAATPSQNGMNKRISGTNKTGVKGVKFKKGAYEASCSVNGVRHYLGRHKELLDAEKIITEFRNKHHGEFAKHF